MCVQWNNPFFLNFLCSLKIPTVRRVMMCFETLWCGYCRSHTAATTPLCFKCQTSSYVLIKCTHTDRPASIMDLPSSLGCNEWDLKQRRMVPASQTLNTQMAQIAYAAPETEKTEVVPEKVKITLNKTRREKKTEKNNMWDPSMSVNDSWDFNGAVASFEVPPSLFPLIIWMLIGCEVLEARETTTKMSCTNTEINYHFATLYRDPYPTFLLL